MVADSEAVRLVADALQQVQPFAFARQEQANGLARLEHFLLLLGEADDRDLGQLDLGHDFHRRRQLALATVNDDQVGQDRPAAPIGNLIAGDRVGCGRRRILGGLLT